MICLTVSNDEIVSVEMAQVRFKRDGSETVANTIYILRTTDDKAKRLAKERSKKKKKVSKSAVLTRHLDTTL